VNDERAERLRQQELNRKAEAFEQTWAARDGFLRRFEREADPDRLLGEVERRAQGLALRAEYMRKLAARSAGARRERALRLRIGDRAPDPLRDLGASQKETRAGHGGHGGTGGGVDGGGSRAAGL